MAKLIIKMPGAPVTEVELKPGVNRLGRSPNADVQISHPSVSGAHGEIVAEDGSFLVKDLGSTNGTLLDGSPIQEAPLQPGQTLRLGDVEISLDATAPAKGALTLCAVEPAPGPAAVAAPEASAARPYVARLASARAARPKKNFFKSIPGAFGFPFRRNGLILLVSGTAFFVIMDFLSGAAGIVGTGVGIFTVGYLFSFAASIVTTSAGGDDEMPAWPDFENLWESGGQPFIQLLAIVLVCLGPVLLYRDLTRDPQLWLVGLLNLAGLAYFPMALLAVAMYDRVAALNPMLVLVSIARVPLEYAVACAVLGALVIVYMAVSYLPEAIVRIPLVRPIIEKFLWLYTMTVVMRLVGLLFYTKQDRLGWAMSEK